MLLPHLALSLKGYWVIERIPPGAAAHVEPCGCWEHARVEGREGGAGRLAGVPPAPAAHGVRPLVSEVLRKLLVCPVIHQTLAVRVQPVGVALVEAGVHLGPEVLPHARARDDGRPLVCPVRVLLHVFSKVGLLQQGDMLLIIINIIIIICLAR